MNEQPCLHKPTLREMRRIAEAMKMDETVRPYHPELFQKGYHVLTNGPKVKMEATLKRYRQDTDYTSVVAVEPAFDVMGNKLENTVLFLGIAA
jgi:hypothetical protein